MKEDDIRNYASLMKELELTGLEIEIDGAKVRLERGNGTAIPQSYTVAPEAPKAEKAEEKEAAGEAVTSPMVGVFYSAPAENSEPLSTVMVLKTCENLSPNSSLSDCMAFRTESASLPGIRMAI